MPPSSAQLWTRSMGGRGGGVFSPFSSTTRSLRDRSACYGVVVAAFQLPDVLIPAASVYVHVTFAKFSVKLSVKPPLPPLPPSETEVTRTSSSSYTNLADVPGSVAVTTTVG